MAVDAAVLSGAQHQSLHLCHSLILILSIQHNESQSGSGQVGCCKHHKTEALIHSTSPVHAVKLKVEFLFFSQHIFELFSLCPVSSCSSHMPQMTNPGPILSSLIELFRLTVD